MADKSVTDKANEQGWGSTVNAAAEQVKQTTDSVAESLRSTVGDHIADGLKAGGEYTKAGIQNTGEAVGLKGSKVRLKCSSALVACLNRTNCNRCQLASLRTASTRQGS